MYISKVTRSDNRVTHCEPRPSIPQWACSDRKSKYRDSASVLATACIIRSPDCGYQSPIHPVVTIMAHWTDSVYGRNPHVFVFTPNGSGYGTASGYGYCKLSQAASDALADAGYELVEDIGGRGTNAVRDALTAIVRHHHPRKHVHTISQGL